MTMSRPTTDTTAEQPATDTPKRRQCLRCQAEFRSEWAGERICARCKSSNAWRSGMPLKPVPSGSRR